jgi:hypothetical protein|tara:strand:- start:876 stop:1169 length:294 start_codon:yes stop_codon:yes gene_type:complete
MDQDQAQKIRYLNSNNGWDGIDDPYVVFKNEPSEIDKTYLRVFSSEEGQKVLEHLKSITIDQPAWTPGSDPSFGYAREGQNSLVREIIQRMRRCNNE